MDELDVINIIEETVYPNKKESPIGDDVFFSGEKKLAVKTDMLVSTTDVPEKMSIEQAARKSVAMCISDLSAKGVVPYGFLVSLGIPKGFGRREVRKLANGFKIASEEWKVRLLGGDTNLTKELIISCTMYGFSDKIISRSGASPGEVVVTNGYFGYAPSGLRILLSNALAGREFKKKAVESVLYPRPRVQDGIILSKYLTSSIDSSDGLAISLHTISRMSSVGITVTNLPVDREVLDFASKNNLSVEELVFYGGEEYLIVGTIKKESIEQARKELENVGGNLIEIGYTRELEGYRVKFMNKRVRMGGWIYSF